MQQRRDLVKSVAGKHEVLAFESQSHNRQDLLHCVIEFESAKFRFEDFSLEFHVVNPVVDVKQEDVYGGHDLLKRVQQFWLVTVPHHEDGELVDEREGVDCFVLDAGVKHMHFLFLISLLLQQ